jgi:hypothetical protein
VNQYMIATHYIDGEAPPADDVMQQMFKDVSAFNAELEAEGAWVFGCGLCPPDTATVVHVTGVDVLITDGPFPEAKEQIGGFWIVKAPDLDAALALAKRASVACRSPLEVRPLQDESED